MKDPSFMLRVAPLLIFLLLLLAGCDMPLTQEDVQKSPEGMLLRHVVDELRAKELQAIGRECAETLTAEPNFEKALATIAALVPGDNAKSISFTDWQYNWDGTGERTAAITAAYEYAGYFLHVSITTRVDDQHLAIEGIDIQKTVEATVEMPP